MSKEPGALQHQVQTQGHREQWQSGVYERPHQRDGIGPYRGKIGAEKVKPVPEEGTVTKGVVSGYSEWSGSWGIRRLRSFRVTKRGLEWSWVFAPEVPMKYRRTPCQLDDFRKQIVSLAS